MLCHPPKIRLTLCFDVIWIHLLVGSFLNSSARWLYNSWKMPILLPFHQLWISSQTANCNLNIYINQVKQCSLLTSHAAMSAFLPPHCVTSAALLTLLKLFIKKTLVVFTLCLILNSTYLFDLHRSNICKVTRTLQAHFRISTFLLCRRR